MPTIPSIRTSVENQNVLVLDDHAKHGIFRRDSRNRLIAYAGGFSVVFPYKTTDGKKWAFRCWHSDISKSQKRYKIISSAIKESLLDFLCEFEYIEKGINVDGTIYPTTRMRWVEGINIKDYICQNKDNKGLLKNLAENFLNMSLALHEKNLAHGDLQHGNILIDNNHHIHLVDYDSFYCPELNGEPDIVTGLADYQHPSRLTNKIITEKIDYFSELIIYLSILAIAEKPSLVDKYKVNDADRLLFSKEDYQDLKKSQIYSDISSLGDKYIDLLDILESFLKKQDINKLEPFWTLLQIGKILFTSSTSKAIRNKQSVEVKWEVPFEAEVSLSVDGDKYTKRKNKGKIKTTLANTTTYILRIKTKDNQVFEKRINIEVFDECDIYFNADKLFIFPGIPVVLSWNVKHAKQVWLDTKKVSKKGSIIVEPTKATNYVLRAKNQIGSIKEKELAIQILPVPQVHSLLVPTPNIASNLGITIQQPKLNVELRFPSINMELVNTEIPVVPSLTDLGLNAELTTPKIPSFNLKQLLNRMLNTCKTIIS